MSDDPVQWGAGIVAYGLTYAGEAFAQYGVSTAAYGQLGAAGTPPRAPRVRATLHVPGRLYTDTNQMSCTFYIDQTIRMLFTPYRRMLISDRVLGKMANKPHKLLPNYSTATAHAEINLLDRACRGGYTQGADLRMTVRGEPICTHCWGDIPEAVRRSGLRSLTLFEAETGTTYYITPDIKSIIKAPRSTVRGRN